MMYDVIILHAIRCAKNEKKCRAHVELYITILTIILGHDHDLQYIRRQTYDKVKMSYDRFS